MTKILLRDKLDDCIARWHAAGYDVIGPQKNNNIARFAPVTKASELDLESILPERTVKDLFFPQTEPMLRYQIGKQKIDTEEYLPPRRKRVVFGSRPCDASAMAIDDPLFGWDYKDAYWFQRRDETVMITIACTAADDFCMCTSLKLSPDSPLGSDVMLRPLTGGVGWHAELLSERGREAFERIEALFDDDANAQPEPIADVPVKFDLDACREWLANPENFESHFWKEISMRCIGCGTCTFLCPTCHCFDFQDEGDTYSGMRRKNWDSCSFALFTMHTSGHNPRSTQSARWRQRIMHKFNYFPGKFNLNSCSGCGRCSRQCPVDMGITETLQEITKVAK
ncbi:MAG: 4Fe-4S dicluster domain-containing protein [Chlorobiaceae bacterium]|nr:4Fe-4S dicluster domain-containing protein [Chlorobiaceae bacterium]